MFHSNNDRIKNFITNVKRKEELDKKTAENNFTWDGDTDTHTH